MCAANAHKLKALRFVDYQTAEGKICEFLARREMAQTSTLTQALHYLTQINLRLRKAPPARAARIGIMSSEAFACAIYGTTKA